jgi:hypothetical protein
MVRIFAIWPARARFTSNRRHGWLALRTRHPSRNGRLAAAGRSRAHNGTQPRQSPCSRRGPSQGSQGKSCGRAVVCETIPRAVFSAVTIASGSVPRCDEAFGSRGRPCVSGFESSGSAARVLPRAFGRPVPALSCTKKRAHPGPSISLQRAMHDTTANYRDFAS